MTGLSRYSAYAPTGMTAFFMIWLWTHESGEGLPQSDMAESRLKNPKLKIQNPKFDHLTLQPV